MHRSCSRIGCYVKLLSLKALPHAFDPSVQFPYSLDVFGSIATRDEREIKACLIDLPGRDGQSAAAKARTREAVRQQLLSIMIAQNGEMDEACGEADEVT